MKAAKHYSFKFPYRYPYPDLASQCKDGKIDLLAQHPLLKALVCCCPEESLTVNQLWQLNWSGGKKTSNTQSRFPPTSMFYTKYSLKGR